MLQQVYHFKPTFGHVEILQDYGLCPVSGGCNSIEVYPATQEAPLRFHRNKWSHLEMW